MEKDIVLKRFFSDNERYVDLINGLGCQGEQVVCKDDLEELDAQSGIWRGFGKGKGFIINTRKKVRDMLRKAAFGVNFAVIGIENQEEIDYSIPLRILTYDTGEYEKQAVKIRKQVRKNAVGLKAGEYMYGFKKESRLYPVITFLLYYGDADWDGPTNLCDMIEFEGIPENLRKMVHNYEVNLVEIRKLEDTNIFQTDVRQEFDIIRCSKDSKKLKELVDGDSYYREMEEDAFDVAVTYTRAEELIRVKDYYRKDGKINMCEALTALIEEGKMEGMELGIEQGVQQGIEQGEDRVVSLNKKLLAENRITDLKRAMEDDEYRKKLYKEFGL